MKVIISTDDYVVFHFESLARVQLWHRWAGEWNIGHSKDIPAHMSAGVAAEYMYCRATGEISHEAYNEALPGS